MQNFKKILVYILPYWTRVVLNIVFNLLSAIFSLFSLTMVIPFLTILFQTHQESYELLPFALNYETIINNFNYYLLLLINSYGEAAALLIISLMVVLASLLKNGFRYLALYHLAPVRNGW